MPLFDGAFQNRTVDPSEEFARQHNHLFLARGLEGIVFRSGEAALLHTGLWSVCRALFLQGVLTRRALKGTGAPVTSDGLECITCVL
jgi:hypothetical protein